MAGNRSNLFYWVSLVMALACVAIMISDHSGLSPKLELAGVPLVLLAGSAAIFSILIHELLDSLADRASQERARKTESKIHADRLTANTPDSNAPPSANSNRSAREHTPSVRLL